MKIKTWIRRYPLTAALSVLIWIACMIPVPETPLSDVNMIDKWTHLVMFGTLSAVVLAERIKNEKKKASNHGQEVASFSWLHALLCSFLFAWCTGGLIELAQAHLTCGIRSGEWLDFFADGIGALLGLPIGILLAKCVARWKKAP
ncbi:MAG: hypothetical protein IJ539_04190 [Prevotella sp.]|jgi:hypothetical protein|nr:hypothetical protein [Prevotella sp.]